MNAQIYYFYSAWQQRPTFFIIFVIFIKHIIMKKVVVLTGAGMSAESGFETFRDSGGLWEKYPVEKVATPEGWRADPDLVTDFYNGLRVQLLTAEPNRGHRLLAALEQDFDVTVVTQNVDDLHERAGSSRVIHLHGELMKVTSSRDPENPHFVRTLSADKAVVPHGAKADDGSLLRPYIVWFGEAVPNMEIAAEEASRADIFVVIGTSFNVYPAAGLINYVPSSAPVYIIDPKEVSVHAAARICFLRKTASEGMEELTDILKKQR